MGKIVFSDDDYSTLFSLVSVSHQAALQRVINFAKNPSPELAESVSEVMRELYEIKHNIKNRDKKKKKLDTLIKYAVRATSQFSNTKKFFDVRKPLRIYKIERPIELLHRLLQVFDDPEDFSSCVEFNFKNLVDLMGEKFIEENSDIISVKEYESAIYLKKNISKES